MSDKETRASAGGLLSYLYEAFGSKKNKPEAPAVKAEALPATVEATETPLMVAAPAPESIPTMMLPGPTVTETPMPVVETAAPAVRDELPDWLQAGEAEAEVEAPLPEVPALAPVLVPEVPPAFTPEAEVETDPFATSREFNGHMEIIRQFQEVLAGGTALDSVGQRQALIAVARANSLLPKLPGEVLKSVLLMRAVASGNPRFGRNDFQLEMLAAMEAIKAGTATKG